MGLATGDIADILRNIDFPTRNHLRNSMKTAHTGKAPT